MSDRDPAINPHKSIWASVMLIAVADALQGPECEPDQNSRIRAITEARQWLTTPSRDLALVCACAGLDMRATIDRMTRLIANAAAPEDLASGHKVSRASLSKRSTPGERKRRVAAVYTMNGQTRTVAEWAKITGIDKHLIHARLSRGWDIADALTLTSDEARHRARQTMRDSIEAEVQGRQWNRGSPARLITHAGRTLTLKQWSQVTGVKIGTLKQRLAKGWTTEQVLTPNNLRGKGAPEPAAKEQA